MNIFEAATQAKAQDGYITTSGFNGSAYIKPTNTGTGCIIYTRSGHSKTGWQPRMNDLIREDWVAVKEEELEFLLK